MGPVYGRIDTVIVYKVDRLTRFVPDNLRNCSPESGSSQQSVRCGAHGWILAEAIARHVCALRAQGYSFTHTNLFVAAPNAIAFFLGQLHQPIGPITVYEWDFNGLRGGGYSPGILIE